MRTQMIVMSRITPKIRQTLRQIKPNSMQRQRADSTTRIRYTISVQKWEPVVSHREIESTCADTWVAAKHLPNDRYFKGTAKYTQNRRKSYAKNGANVSTQSPTLTTVPKVIVTRVSIVINDSKLIYAMCTQGTGLLAITPSVISDTKL